MDAVRISDNLVVDARARAQAQAAYDYDEACAAYDKASLVFPSESRRAWKRVEETWRAYQRALKD